MTQPFSFCYKLYAHFGSDFFKALYDKVNVFLCMVGTDLGSDSGLALRNYRVGEGYNINAFLNHAAGEFRCQLFVIEHDRYAWVDSWNDIKAFFTQLFAVIGGDVFQMVT